MEELKRQLQEEYGFVIKDYRDVGGQTLLTTNTGLYYLYSCPSAYRYKNTFIEKVKKHVVSKTNFGVLSLIKTRKGSQYFVDGEDMYYVQRGVREALPADIPFATGQALAEFHAATGSFTGEKMYYPYRSLGSWPNMWRKRIKKYEDLRDQFDSNEGVVSDFDEFLLTSFTYVHQLGNVAHAYLKDAGYERMTKVTEPFGKIAFQNFDHGYLLFEEDGRRHFAGQINWVIDMRARDIGQWIKAEVRHNGWNPQVVMKFLEGYNSVSLLLDQEYAIIYALLLYPGRYLKAIETYSQLTFEERASHDFQDWQLQMEEELAFMEPMLRDFPDMIAVKFNIDIPHIPWLWRSPDDDTLYLRDTEDIAYDDLTTSTDS